MKLNELKGQLDAIHGQTQKAFGEIRNKLDDLTATIGVLEERLQNAEVPEDVSQAIEDLKALAVQLDDIVPDAPEATTGGNIDPTNPDEAPSQN